MHFRFWKPNKGHNSKSYGPLATILQLHLTYLGDQVFVCVEVLRPSQPNGVMLSVVSLPNHTFTGQA